MQTPLKYRLFEYVSVNESLENAPQFVTEWLAAQSNGYLFGSIACLSLFTICLIMFIVSSVGIAKNPYSDFYNISIPISAVIGIFSGFIGFLFMFTYLDIQNTPFQYLVRHVYGG